MIERIRARRDALDAQISEARAQYDQLETTLKELDRQILAMYGGLHELDQLLSDGTAEPVSPYETGLNGAHAAALEGDI